MTFYQAIEQMSFWEQVQIAQVRALWYKEYYELMIEACKAVDSTKTIALEVDDVDPIIALQGWGVNQIQRKN